MKTVNEGCQPARSACRTRPGQLLAFNIVFQDVVMHCNTLPRSLHHVALGLGLNCAGFMDALAQLGCPARLSWCRRPCCACKRYLLDLKVSFHAVLSAYCWTAAHVPPRWVGWSNLVPPFPKATLDSKISQKYVRYVLSHFQTSHSLAPDFGLGPVTAVGGGGWFLNSSKFADGCCSQCVSSAKHSGTTCIKKCCLIIVHDDKLAPNPIPQCNRLA